MSKPTKRTAIPYTGKMDLVVRPGAKYAQAEEWARHRETITRLYQAENKSLKELMAIMERDYNHVGTPKMYKVRIKKWHLEKTPRDDEVVEMLRLKRARDAQGKKTVFYVRNRKVDWNDVKRYMKNRNHLVAKMNATTNGELEVGNSRYGIVARTPSPDPAAEFSVPPQFNAADDISFPEQILLLSRAVYDGALDFQTKRWTDRYLDLGISPVLALFGDPQLRRVTRWFQRFQLAADNRSEVLEFPQRRADATRMIDVLLGDEPAKLVSEQMFTFSIAFPFVLLVVMNKDPAVARLLMDFFSRLTPLVLGPNHPFALAWVRLGKLKGQALFHSLVPMLKLTGAFASSCVPVVEVRGESKIPATTASEREEVRKLIKGLKIGGVKDQPGVMVLNKPLDIPESYSQPPEHNWQEFTVRAQLETNNTFIFGDTFSDLLSKGLGKHVGWHISNLNYKQALKELNGIKTYLDSRPDQEGHQVRAVRSGHGYYMGKTFEGFGNYPEALRWAREGYKHALAVHGYYSMPSITLLAGIVRYYEKLGDPAAAAQWNTILDEAWQGVLGTVMITDRPRSEAAMPIPIIDRYISEETTR